MQMIKQDQQLLFICLKMTCESLKKILLPLSYIFAIRYTMNIRCYQTVSNLYLTEGHFVNQKNARGSHVTYILMNFLGICKKK